MTRCGHQSTSILLFPLFNLSRSPKVRTGRPDHFENEIGFNQEFFFFFFFLIKNDFLRRCYLGFD